MKNHRNVNPFVPAAVILALLMLMGYLDEHDQCDAATATCEATTPAQR